MVPPAYKHTDDDTITIRKHESNDTKMHVAFDILYIQNYGTKAIHSTLSDSFGHQRYSNTSP